MCKNYIFQSPFRPWQYYNSLDKPQWRYTVSEWTGLVLFGLAITVTLLVTQRRSWAILRYVGDKLAPNPIAFSANHDDQGHEGGRPSPSFFMRALATFTPFFSRRRGRSRRDPDRTETPVTRNDIELSDFHANEAVETLVREAISALTKPDATPPRMHVIVLGLFALLNYVMWLALSIGIGAYLSYWPDDSPIVLSKLPIHHTCQLIKDLSKLSAIVHIADGFYRQCWLRQLGSSSDPFCGTAPIIPDRPVVKIEWVDYCPFGGKDDNSCHITGKASPSSVVVMHENLFPADVGLNYPALLSVSHRLVCAPVNIEDYITPLTFIEGEQRAFVQFADKDTEPGWMAKNYWNLNLLTLNGPNKFDEYPSGSDVFSLGGPWDLHVWPTRKRDARHPKWVPETGLLESLRFRGLANETSAEGTQFILGYRAGQTAYPGPVDDPMFGAHTYRGENRYWPDYEMTAMQCIEQYRVSDHRKSSGPTATPWMSQYDIYSDDFWTNNGLLSSFIDNRGLLTLMMTYPSVYDHLYQKQGVQALLAAMHKDESIIYGIDDQEQWIREMKAWMEIGIIKARYTFLQMVAGHTDGDRETSSLVAIGNYSDYRDGATICDHVLIRDPDSTDIDAVGIWCFLGLQLIIILCSYLGAARRGVCTMYARFCQPRRNRVVFYEEEGRSTRHSSPPPRQSLGGDTLVPSAMASSLEVAGDEGSRPRFSTDSNRTLVQRNSDIDIQRSGMPCEVPECQCGVKGKGKAKETVESADGGEASGSFDG